MIKAIAILFVSGVAMITAGCEINRPGQSIVQSNAAQRDYEVLSGTWQLTRGVDNGKPVPASVGRNTILITDHNTFRFPKASGIGTHPAGRFSVNPDTRPKRVDTIAEGGPNAGQLTRGIYEIIDATHKRACWGPSGGPRPTEFTSPCWKRTDSSILEENRTCTATVIFEPVSRLASDMLYCLLREDRSFNETRPLGSSRLHRSSAPVLRVAVLFILAIYGRVAIS
jgi:uncharacterized protein (TIGR03067 family)